MALVSAHRGGAGEHAERENSLAAFEAAIEAGCEFVEFDVRLTRDGRAVLFHDDEWLHADGSRSIAAHHLDDLSGITALEPVLDLVAGRAKAQVDLKVSSGEIEVAQRIIDVLGVDNTVITTTEDDSVRRLIDWSRVHAPGLRVGLSSGVRSHPETTRDRWRARLGAWFPRTRLRRSRSNVVVAHQLLARWSLRSYARRRGLPLIVWTVDDADELDYWMNDPHTWIVTTNFPDRALAARR